MTALRSTAGRLAPAVAVAVLALGALAVGCGGVLAVGGVDLSLGAHGRYHAPGYAR